MGKSLIRCALVAQAVSGLLFASSHALAQPQTASEGGYTEKVIYRFPGLGNPSPGLSPLAGLARDTSGNLYGTTYYGGAAGRGTAFKIDPAGNEAVLHSFTGSLGTQGCSTNCDGSYPTGGVILDDVGNVYGTTLLGGDLGAQVLYDDNGAGVVFRIDPTGRETNLYSFLTLFDFTIFGTDAGLPVSTLTRDSQGNLFGTQSEGGMDPVTGNEMFGGVFKIDASGKFTQLYRFTGGTDGFSSIEAESQSRLLLDASGNLYGTTAWGGDPTCLPEVGRGCGVLFKLSPDGTESVIHAFHGGADGIRPVGDIAWDGSGNLVGVTRNGGANNNGTVFRINLSTGQETILYSFESGLDGQPLGGLIGDNTGTFYGTTVFGGRYNRGTVFKLDSQGHRTNLHSFNGGQGGGRPVGSLLLNPSGAIYGVTADGGAGDGGGVVFALIPRG